MTLTEIMVFCQKASYQSYFYKNSGDSDTDAVYDAFLTEDDVRLLAVVHEVEKGTMTPQEAFDLYPYLRDDEDDYDAEDCARELKFPDFSALVEREEWPGRDAFYDAATGIGGDDEHGGGAGDFDGVLSPASGLVWKIEGVDVLDAVPSALRGQYKIIVTADPAYTWPDDQVHAERIIEAACACTALGE